MRLFLVESFEEVLRVVILRINATPREDIRVVSPLRVSIARSDDVLNIQNLIFAEVEELLFSC